MAPTQNTTAGAWLNLKRIPLIVHLLLLASTQMIAAPVEIGIPAAQRNEGRVVLEYVKNEETIKYQLAFSEVVDRETSRSKVSIGYMSYEPTVYYSRDGEMLTVDKNTGQCVSLKSKGYKLVPELDWFLKLSYTDEELERALPSDKSHHLIGASGIVFMLTKTQTKFSHQERHRNIDCHVATAMYGRTKAKDILYELFVPDLKMFETNKMTFFSVRESVKSAKLEDGTEFSATLTIDYFYTEEINKNNLHQVDRLEVDLNLPLGIGCSELLSTATRPEPRGSQSFLMTYNQNSAQSVLELAYDHGANLLRKEVLGKSVTVWDLGEDLVYHVDQTVNGKLFNEAETEVPYGICSVLSVESSSGKSGSNNNSSSKAADQTTTTTTKSVMMKPYKRSASSLDVLEFLGAQEIYYMGQASVRDLPCWIFEITLREPPRIFEIDLRVERVDESAPEQATDYIVQFYIFKTSGSTTTSILSPSAAANIIGNKFWPARISLIQRHKASASLMLHDILEVGDFHWGLYGWTKKPSEMFMMPECFNREDEQLRISLALEFDRLLLSADNQRLLRHNKYKLESDLIAAMFGSTGKSLLQVSQLHLTEFELTLRAHNVLAQLVLSDRLEDKRLSYFGEGDLPNTISYQNQRISLTNLDSSGNTESACIMSASHIAQISMVIYCPSRDWVAKPTCTAIFDEPQPVIRRTDPSKPSGESFVEPKPVVCQVYRFESRDPPRAATHEVDKIKKQLLDYRFVFTAQQPAGSGVDQGYDDADPKGIVFNGVVRDFHVSRELELITVSNYKYVVEEANNTRSFETIKYNNLGDCVKMCDLDSSCKSYSYCNGGDSGKCILASLDLRQNGVEHQLVNSKLADDDNRVLVRDLSSTGDANDTNHNTGVEYKLDLKNGCNIYERNFLNMFTRTDELIRIRANVAANFHTAPSASECARWINVLEDQMDSVHTSMFAYCSNSNTCLIDENFFVSLAADNKTTDDPDAAADDGDVRELTCQVFRRRYQNYFHILPRAVKRKPNEEESARQLVQQTEFQFNSVEQCARACWQSFGHSCLSFDFCSPSNCLLNLIADLADDQVTSEQLAQSMDWEVRTGCLHYERDLQWDKLRRDHSIGHSTPLVLPSRDSPKQSSNGLVANFGLLVISSILFILGLAVGHRVNRSLAFATPALRRAPKDSRPPERTAFGLSSSASSLSSSSSPYERMSSSSTNFAASASSKFTIENEIYEDPDAIRLEEMGANKRQQVDESEAEAEVQTQAQRQQQQSADLMTIQVPDLMKI